MSDQKSSFGEPVDEPKDADSDVVGRAHEGLADAEAARHESTAADSASTTADEPAVTASEPAAKPAEPIAQDSADDERTRAHDTVPAAASATTPWYERQDEDEARWAAYAASADTPAAERSSTPDDTPTVVAAPVVAPAAAASEPNPAVFPAGQPIFVQAPEAPNLRGNRGAAGAIGLLAALAFAVLYLAATLGIGYLSGDVRADGVVEAIVAAVTSWALWVPVVVFFIAFWLLGGIINRGRWGHWVVWGLLVGVAAWGGHVLGQLFEAPFWLLTTRQGATLIEEQVFAPLAIVAFVLGRELTIWFGAWVASRGKRMTELNLEAQREYERTLEAGPQLHRG